MCGITGILSLDGPRPIPREILTRMNGVIRHRGPDSEGFHIEPDRIGMAMRRLAIIDLEGGRQPLANENDSIWITFNGEVYNFAELRRELESRGHVFRTRSDTESILHAYEEYGDDCVRRLRGMFGFAVWDGPARRLLLARDRVGIKQLFYTVVDGQLIWGSEIKALLQHPAVRRELDLDSLNQFMALGYVPSPDTMFRGIRELDAGHVLVAEKGEVHTRKYWELEYRPDTTRGPAETAAEFRALLDDAVRVRMISDVPLGAFLSGGIDSGSIVALMAGHASAAVKTFSIGYENGGEAFDEREPASRVARQYATEHHEYVVQPDLTDVTAKLVRAFDQPIADSSAIPNWYLSELTRRHVTVALSGLGGDELAAGYERYRGALLAEKARFVPEWVRRNLLHPLTERLPDSSRGFHWPWRIKRFVRAMGLPFDDRYFALISLMDRDLRAELLAPGERGAIDLDRPAARHAEHLALARDAHPLNRALFSDLKLYLPGDLLTLTDRVSMAHSLEVRVPFLDHHLLEFAATVPPDLKLRGMERKHILKQAVRDLLPPELLNRKKMGFSVPITVWFRNELRPWVEEMLCREEIDRLPFFDYRAVRSMMDRHFGLQANHDQAIWALITFVIWHREYIAEGRPQGALAGE